MASPHKEEDDNGIAPLSTPHHHHHHHSMPNQEQRHRNMTTSSSPITSAHHNHHQKRKNNHHHHHHNHNHSPLFTTSNKFVQCAKNYILPIIVCLIGGVAWTVATCILIPGAFLHYSTIMFVLNQVIGSTEVFLMFWSYFKCVKTSPGYASSDWEVNQVRDDQDRVQLLRLEPAKNGEARYCAKCGIYQPPRAHHSRAHNKCVLRMDHYCVWVNNVVGAFNHKFFYLFLLYLCLGIAHYFLLVMVYGYRLVNDLTAVNPIPFVVLIIFTVFLLPITLMVYMFFGWNTYLLLTNQTSIENHINSEINIRLKYRKKKKNSENGDKVQFRHIYNVNMVDNVKNVLGDRVLLWFLPTDPTGSDGYHFKTIGVEEVERVNAYIQDARPDESAYVSESSDDEGSEEDEEDLDRNSIV